MTSRATPLTPFPLGTLLGRIAHEWETRQRIFDLQPTRFFDVSTAPDLSVEFLGRRAATPLGPAAGPHSQLAGNIVLAWLGGARVVELKTVQVLDEIEIGRPCIDMETVGYNVEWSQELRIGQSLFEVAIADQHNSRERLAPLREQREHADLVEQRHAQSMRFVHDQNKTLSLRPQ